MPETISVHNMFSPGLSLEFLCIELVIYGLVDAKIKASDKDLPVQNAFDMSKKIKLLYLLLFL